MSYTLEDLERAKVSLERIHKAFENYSGNNPNAYRTDSRLAVEEVRRIEAYLKSVGIIELTEEERLYQKIDAAYPSAKSKDIVEYEGKNYIRRFYPLGKSLSGKTVTEWGKSWELTTDRPK